MKFGSCVRSASRFKRAGGVIVGSRGWTDVHDTTTAKLLS